MEISNVLSREQIVPDGAPEEQREETIYDEVRKIGEIFPIAQKHLNYANKKVLYKEFLDKHPDIKKTENERLCIDMAIGGAGGSLGGAAIGGGIGFAIGNWPGACIGVSIGVAVGGVGGTATGWWIGKNNFANRIVNMKPYQEEYLSKNASLNENYKNCIEEIAKDSDAFNTLDKFLCPITRDFILVPVKIPQQKRTYEKKDIERCINDKPEGNNSPTREGHMSLDALKYNFDYLPNLTKTIIPYAAERGAKNFEIFLNKKVEILGKTRKIVVESLIQDLALVKLTKKAPEGFCDSFSEYLTKEYKRC